MLNIVNLFHQGKPLACDKLIIYFVAVVVEFKKKKTLKRHFIETILTGQTIFIGIQICHF